MALSLLVATELLFIPIPESVRKVTFIDRSRLIELCRAPLSIEPRPFLTWAGSKRLILSHIVHLLPRQYRRYYEPFLGSGALFFLLQPPRATLGDSCGPLIETYRAIGANPSAVWRYLSSISVDRDTYTWVRENRSRGTYKNAAEFIYLNKTCWNGLYRVNASGKFNVPFGRPNPKAAIAHKTNLQACSEALARPNVTLLDCDFLDSLNGVGEGDLVYLDPPYVTGHSNNGFIDYNEVLFSWEDQERLAQTAADLKTKGAHVIVSNADHPAIRDLYSRFRIVSFDRQATISGKVSSRGTTKEILASSH